MAATHSWSETNGAGPSGTPYDGIGNINFGNTDAHDLTALSYPIARGSNSFAKYIRCLFTSSWTTISNMKFWKSNGDYKTDEVIVANFNVSYATPATTSIGVTAVPTAAPAQNVNSFEGEATIVYGATGVSGYTGYINLQLKTLSDTPSGAVATKTFCFQYDEV